MLQFLNFTVDPIESAVVWRSGRDSGILCCPGPASDTDRPSYLCFRRVPDWPNSALCVWWVLCRRTVPTPCPVVGGLPSSGHRGPGRGRVWFPCPSHVAASSTGREILERWCLPHTSSGLSILQTLTQGCSLPPHCPQSPQDPCRGQCSGACEWAHILCWRLLGIPFQAQPTLGFGSSMKS